MFYKIKRILLNFFNYTEKDDYDFSIPLNTGNEETNPYKDNEPTKIYSSITKNLDYLKYKYNTLINTDIVIREFTFDALNKTYNAFIIFIDGLVDANIINDFTLKPLMQSHTLPSKKIPYTQNQKKEKNKKDLYSYVYNCLLPQNAITDTSDFDSVLMSINRGHCLLFVDGLTSCYNIDTKNYKQRSIDNPNNEIVIRGSQEAFNEILRTNTSLIRRIVNNENLVIESITVGKINKNPCAICYINNIANSNLVSEVKYRINNIDIDFLISSGQLEQLIEDSSNISLPQVIATERPDRASHYLLEGRVAIIVNGSPYILVVPGVFNDFLSSPEDFNLKFQFSNVLKFLRLMAFLFTLLLPGFYMAVTNFHQELLPTEFLFTIIASRASVPFPIIFEILIMESSFELIREASIRVPSTIGPTIRNYWCFNTRRCCCKC
ncbi:MAG: spore germination protein [Clostridia bacterium]|nr:spore germination protein [Clostridia bacterium]